MNVWERQKGEPNIWYDRFELFRLMGSGRSLLGSYKKSLEKGGKGRKKPPTDAPTAWKTAAEKWNWHRRAEAWDDYLRELDREAFDREREEARTKRRQIITVLEGILSGMTMTVEKKGQVEKRVLRTDYTPGELSSLTTAAKNIFNESRIEFNDLPAQRHEVAGPGGGPMEMKFSDMTDEELDERIINIVGQLVQGGQNPPAGDAGGEKASQAD